MVAGAWAETSACEGAAYETTPLPCLIEPQGIGGPQGWLKKGSGANIGKIVGFISKSEGELNKWWQGEGLGAKEFDN